MSLDVSACPEFLKPRLRLFLSADIVGSTALKQSPFDERSRANQRTQWFSKIQGFYFQAQQAFLAQCHKYQHDNIGRSFGPMPELWKTIGDEVLFVKEVTDHRQIVDALRCWMAAVPEMRQFVKKDNERLDVKCTAWLAGFPLRNSEVVVSNEESDLASTGGEWFVSSGKILDRLYTTGPESKVRIDYIGPSIDIGFRLGAFSSARKFIVSIDVAYVLSIANPGDVGHDSVFELFFDGSKPLKGVLGGLDYPVFWLDLSPPDSLDRVQDRIASNTPLNRDRLRAYCAKFFSVYDKYTFAPFINEDAEQQIAKRPEWYDVEHNALVRSYLSQRAALDDVKASIENDEPVAAAEESNHDFVLFWKTLREALNKNEQQKQ